MRAFVHAGGGSERRRDVPKTSIDSTTIRAAQIVLTGLGFPVAMDGVLGPRTRAAIRAFQRGRKLPQSGTLDRATLAALGLPVPDTIDFGDDETEVPPAVQRRIREYADLLARQHDTLVDASRDALLAFQSRMSAASTREAKPDLLSVFAGSAYAAGAGVLESFVASKALGAGLTFFKTFAEGTVAELQRSAAAAASLGVAHFVTAALETLHARRSRFRHEETVEEVSLAFLEAADRQAFLDVLVRANERLAAGVVPPLPFFVVTLYESWIDAHFDGFTEDGLGVVECRFEVDGHDFEFVSCTVETPFGDRVEDALNDILARGVVARLKGPLDLAVRKRACFRVTNLVGGRSWSCGWLDRNNRVIHRPTLPNADSAFDEPVWRVATRAFTR
jgi:peptidoglycan hydrolase-like protein with peptidoglycan-binding domain